MQAQITQTKHHWYVTGDILVDSANSVLEASKELALEDDARIDFKSVNEIDTAAVSLMLEWKRRAIAEKKSIKFANMPVGLTSLLQLYEITDFLN